MRETPPSRKNRVSPAFPAQARGSHCSLWLSLTGRRRPRRRQRKAGERARLPLSAGRRGRISGQEERRRNCTAFRGQAKRLAIAQAGAEEGTSSGEESAAEPGAQGPAPPRGRKQQTPRKVVLTYTAKEAEAERKALATTVAKSQPSRLVTAAEEPRKRRKRRRSREERVRIELKSVKSERPRVRLQSSLRGQESGCSVTHSQLALRMKAKAHVPSAPSSSSAATHKPKSTSRLSLYLEQENKKLKESRFRARAEIQQGGLWAKLCSRRQLRQGLQRML